MYGSADRFALVSAREAEAGVTFDGRFTKGAKNGPYSLGCSARCRLDEVKMRWLLICDVLFIGVSFGGWWYLQRRGKATPARSAVLFVVSAAIFLLAPSYIRFGVDRETILVGTVATVWAVGIPVLVILAASRPRRGR